MSQHFSSHSLATTVTRCCGFIILGVFTRVRVELSLLLDKRVRHSAANPGGYQVVIREGNLIHPIITHLYAVHTLGYQGLALRCHTGGDWLGHRWPLTG